MNNIANNLITALTATFRADAQDLLETVKALSHTWDANPDMDFALHDAILLSVDAIKREVQERLAHEADELIDNPNYPIDLVLNDVQACINEFFA